MIDTGQAGGDGDGGGAAGTQGKFIVCEFHLKPSSALSCCLDSSLVSPTPTAHNQAEAKEGEALVDVTVIAHAVEKVDYYENGEHF